MAKQTKTEGEAQLVVNELGLKEIRFNILYKTPMIMNRFAQKAWQELLFPSKKENRAGLEQRLKHDPYAEYRGALYRNREDNSPAMFHIPNPAFHGALASAALDIPGAKKAQIERLTQVVDLNIELFGTPQLFCAMVRNSDMARTPDVRTRPIFPEWACQISVQYVKNNLTERTVANLLGAAGLIVGIGDWRPQKGGPFGRFELVGDDNAKFQSIVKNQGRKAQQAAFDHPTYFDKDTEELLAWFDAEVQRREMTGQLSTSGKKGKGKKGNGGDVLPDLPIIEEDRHGNYLSE